MNHTPDTELTEPQQEMRRTIAAAVRFGILTHAADKITALPQDYECDPGRGNAVDLLREWALDSDPLTITLDWAGSVSYPDGSDLTQKAVIDCSHAFQGVTVDLVVKGEQRIKLASLLDMELRDPYAKCSTPGCGTTDDCDASDPALFAWARLEVAGTGDQPSWYCTPMCVSNALARAGDELAAADHRAELDGGL
ncbi:hypothetical protein [Streptomyces prunicolor]|uniref:hypothetical protein n=1 Tax=Streptomyces prunicolor TaxID=67348 RepID=UPI00036B406E|nr:hypothetical protein [Streptomyces prunicolor]